MHTKKKLNVIMLITTDTTGVIKREIQKQLKPEAAMLLHKNILMKHAIHVCSVCPCSDCPGNRIVLFSRPEQMSLLRCLLVGCMHSESL